MLVLRVPAGRETIDDPRRATSADSADTSAFAAVMDHVAQAFETLGALILVIGVVWSFVFAVLVWHRSGSPQRAYAAVRQASGGTLLLTLEVPHSITARNERYLVRNQKFRTINWSQLAHRSVAAVAQAPQPRWGPVPRGAGRPACRG